MKISNKISLYTAGMALAIGGFMILYFLLLLPGLYTDYQQKEDLVYIGQVQDFYKKGGSFPDMKEKNRVQSFVLTFPKNGYDVKLDSPYGGTVIEIIDADIRRLIVEMQSDLKKLDFEENSDFDSMIDTEKYETLLEQIFSLTEITERFRVLDTTSSDIFTTQQDMGKAYQTPGGSWIYYSTAEIYNNSYTNYIGMSEGEDSYFLTMAPTITPQLSDLFPVLLQSTPMILVILLLFSILVAYIFTKALAGPVKILAGQATKMKELDEVDLIRLYRKDEFLDLETALNQLYTHLKGLIQKEQKTNALLKKEHENQELFMMDASHQLKTPIAAMILLTEGMINKVGRYADADAYLPELKKKLMQMQQIVYEVLDTFKNVRREVCFEDVEVKQIIEAVLEHYRLLLREKDILLKTELRDCKWQSDREMLYGIMDNLFSNAIRYTPAAQEIQVYLDAGGFRMINTGVQIEEKLLANIFSPFVSSGKGEDKGHGLGLYVASVYGQMLNIQLSIKNGKNCVIVEGRFKGNV